MDEARVRALMALAVAKAAPADAVVVEPDLGAVAEEPAGATEPVDEEGLTATETAVVAALTAWFASALAIPATTLPGRLVAELAGLGIPRRAATAAGELASYPPLTGRTRHGSPGPRDRMTTTRRVANEEPKLRARYVLAAARRLAVALANGDFNRALERERRYRDAHRAAGRNRRAAAQRLDRAASESRNGWLIWRTKGDDSVGPECQALEGRLFTVDNLPGGLIPGAVHPTCRCWPQPWGA